MRVPRVSSKLNEVGLGTREQESLLRERAEKWAREKTQRERAEQENSLKQIEQSKFLAESGHEVIFLGKKVKQNYGFIVAFLDSLVLDDAITGRAMGLLFYLLKKLNYNTMEIKVKPKEAMQELGITRDAYNRWLKEFINREIIEKIDAYTYKLKPNNLKDVVS